jgi:hypothetical protein
MEPHGTSKLGYMEIYGTLGNTPMEPHGTSLLGYMELCGILGNTPMECSLGYMETHGTFLLWIKQATEYSY